MKLAQRVTHRFILAQSKPLYSLIDKKRTLRVEVR